MNLFDRPPEPLDYTPKFSREEIGFGYEAALVQIGGGLGDMDFDPNDIQYETRHTIYVAGDRIESRRQFYNSKTKTEMIVDVVNDFLSNTNNKCTKAWAFFSENAKELNNSRRYWDAVKHREEIEATRKKALDMLDQVRRAEWVASMYAVQVKAERWLTKEEKALLLAEFSGGEYEDKND